MNSQGAEAFPLHWPDGWPRTPAAKRERARFGKSVTQSRTWDDGKTTTWRQRGNLTVAQARERLEAELDRMGATGIVISSNVALRLDGLPRSGQRAPDDPGVCVYFQLRGAPHCLPCDRWDRVADNLAAIAAHVGAMRGMERWGVGSLEQIFAGFKALPPQGGTTIGSNGPPWWTVLGLAPTASLDQVRAAHRALARQHHPDAGGDTGAMAMVNRAREQAEATCAR